MKKLFLICTFLIFASISSGQTVRYVYSSASGNGDGTSWTDAFTTIQAAINAANDGDVILVGYGSDNQTYTYSPSSQLDINNKNLKITSAKKDEDSSWENAQYDSSKLAISGGSSHRIFYIHGSNITSSTIIRGFKLINGVGNEYGGAIMCDSGADPKITNCWITGNIANSSGNGHGGGIAYVDVNATITNNLIENNYASNYNNYSSGTGGGIYVGGGTATITGNIIRNNVAKDVGIGYAWGGGIAIYNGYSTISNNTISGNIARKSSSGRGYGGGISISGSSSGNQTITDNTIENNIANSGADNSYGGGLYLADFSGTVTIEDNTFYNNTASTYSSPGTYNYGGGISSDRGSITVKNNIFNHNTVLSNSGSQGAWGGGVYINSSGNTIENNTFYENADRTTAGSGSGGGSGIYLRIGASSFINNIFVNHNTTSRPNSDATAIMTSDQGGANVTYCAFYNNGINIGNYASDGGNNITSNPQFTDAANGDFTLQYNSPCIDAGSGDYTYNESSNHDYGWKKDIGAEEYSGTRVSKSVSGTGEYIFGGKVRAKINITTQGSLSALDITVHENEAHSQASNTVKRWFDISPTGSGYTCDITLSYKDSELNGENETGLKMYRWNGSSWEGPKTASESSTENNYLKCTRQTAFSDWILDADGVTPVELTSFTANVNENLVVLNWQTATEVNNYGFEVQRKKDKVQSDWTNVGFVEGHGNSNSPKEYSFVDDNPPSGNIQYRLKQIDIDGQFEYSDIVEVNIGVPGKFELFQNYPNPFNPTTTIKYSILAQQASLRVPTQSGRGNLSNDAQQIASSQAPRNDVSNVTLKVYDILGREVATLVSQKQAPGNYSVQFDASKLSSGIYFYKLQSGSFMETKKMILLR